MSYVLCLQLLLTSWAGRVTVTINILPDDVLLIIFLFDRLTFLDGRGGRTWGQPWRWQRLVHVCRRWRSVTFSSPKFLDLKLTCLPNTRVELTHIWPPLPIVIKNEMRWSTPEDYDFDAAIVHPNRVCEIVLYLSTNRAFQRLAWAMREPFPVLTQLGLHFDLDNPDSAPVLPNGFLVGSTSRLRCLELDKVTIPGLPKLLLSATHLVTLRLRRTPHSAYIPPKAMVACLSVLTSLETFALGFLSDEESVFSLRPERRRLPPPTRAVLPTLTHFEFTGACEYLDDLVARLTTPRLFHLYITFFETTASDTPHLVQFIGRTPSLEAPETAQVIFDDETVQVGLSHQTSGNGMLDVDIRCESLDDQLSSLGDAYTSCLPPLDTVENLYITGDQFFEEYRQDIIMNMLWLDFWQPFTSVKNLYISRSSVPHIGPALDLLARGRTTEVLPNLQNLFLEGPRPPPPGWVHYGIKKFVAMRQLFGNTITISAWNGDRL